MKEFTYTITDENGIHARPAGLLVRKAASFLSDITIKAGEKTASAKKLFGLMGLGIKNGDIITVSVSGADEETAADELESFLRENL